MRLQSEREKPTMVGLRVSASPWILGRSRLYVERWAAIPCRFAQPQTQTLAHGKLPFHPNKRTINSEHIFKLCKTFGSRPGKRAPSRFEQTEHERN